MKNTKSFLKLLFLGFVFSSLGIIIFNILNSFFPEYIQSYGELAVRNRIDFSNVSPWRIILSACIMAPLVEESCFRANLSKKQFYHYLAIAVSIVFLLISTFSNYFHNEYYLLVYCLGVFVIFKFTKNSFPIRHMLIVSSIAFGFLHISNTNHDLFWNPFSYLVYTIPLMVFGYFLGLIRLKHGILFSILAHFIKNAIAILMLFIRSL